MPTKSECRYVPTSDAHGATREWKFTSNQWKVYYWLLMNSKWNARAKEDHYYIYKNKFTQDDIIKDTHIGSKASIKRAFDALEAQGAIEYNEQTKAYLLYFPRLYVPISTTILKVFFAFDWVDMDLLVHLYSTLLLWSQSENPEFSVKFMYGVMDRYYSVEDRPKFIMCLSTLWGIGLIDVEKHSKTVCGKKTIEYLVTEVKKDIDLEEVFGDEGEIDQDRCKNVQDKCALAAGMLK